MNREELKQRAFNIIDNCKKEARELNEEESKELQEIKDKLANQDEVEENVEVINDDNNDNEVSETIEEVVEETEERAMPMTQEEDENEGNCGTAQNGGVIGGEIRKNNNNLKSNIGKMNKEFRLIKAIRDIANNRSLDEVSAAVVQAGADEMRKSGLSFGGQIQLPMETRSIHVTLADGVHDDLIETDFTNILEPLRAKNVLIGAGAKYLSNLVGDVQVPSMTASNVGWAGEVADAEEGSGTFSHVVLQPKRLTAYIDLSKQFLAQDSLAAEQLIREDLVKAINSKLEETILGDGAGDANTPEGILHVITPTSVSDFKGVVDKEADVEDANVLGECVYVMSNKAKAAFRAMAKSTKSTQLVMENGAIDGTKVYNTSNVAGTNYIYGDFSNLAIGQWGSIDLTVDPFTLARSGQVRLVVNAYFDAKVLRAGAFTAGTVE